MTALYTEKSAGTRFSSSIVGTETDGGAGGCFDFNEATTSSLISAKVLSLESSRTAPLTSNSRNFWFTTFDRSVARRLTLFCLTLFVDGSSRRDKKVEMFAFIIVAAERSLSSDSGCLGRLRHHPGKAINLCQFNLSPEAQASSIRLDNDSAKRRRAPFGIRLTTIFQKLIILSNSVFT